MGFGIFTGAPAPTLRAALSTWAGGTGDWSTAANWSPATLPATSSTININTGHATLSTSVTTAFGVIGAGAADSGTLTVSGYYRTTNNLQIGGTGAGALHVLAGGTVANASLYLGNASLGTGTALIEGRWETTSGNFVVGNSGTGIITIGTGGSGYAFNSVYLGNSAGGHGTANVAGLLQSATHFYIGNNGTGILNILGTGTVITGSHANIGATANAGSTGTATVAPGGLWQVAGNLYVGNSGNGALDIKSGGAVTTDANANFANAASRTGTATVAGLLQVAGEINIGQSGTGLLDITGTVTSAAAYIGRNTTATGSVAVSGYGYWSASDLYLGNNGAGALTVAATGTLASATAFIATNTHATATGSATIAGLWKITGSLFVGNQNAGSLDITPSGSVTTTAQAWIGASATAATGVMTVAGYFKPGNSLYIGGTGAGTLEITGAGIVDAQNIAVGGNASSSTSGSGALIISGTGLLKTVNLFVGQYGTGTLHIAPSGTLLDTGDLQIGRYAAATAAATIAGYMENNNNFYIGNLGAGTLDIKAGGTVRSTGAGGASIGQSTGTGAGTVAGHWVVTNTLFVGRGGAGSLTINGGTVTAGATRIANAAAATGTLALNGGLLETASLSAGAGAAAFSFNGGTIAATADSANFLALPTLAITGVGPGGSGTLTLDTRAFSLTATNAFSSPAASTLAKTGAGDFVLTGVSPAFAGTLDIRSGTLVVAPAARLAGTTVIAPGATLRGASAAGTGTLGHLTLDAAATLDLRAAPLAASGNVTFADGAILRLLLDSPQTLAIGGALALSGTGTLLIERGSLDLDDLADLAGTSHTLATFSALTGVNYLQNWNLSVPDFTLDAILSATTTPGALVLLINNADVDRLVWNTGPGAWDASAQNWHRATSPGINVAWSADARAIFSDPPAGAVTVTGSHAIAGLRFDTDGYTLAGTGTLAAAAAPSINVTAASATATISAALKAPGFAKDGPGTLILAAASAATIAGPVTINAGLLSVTGTAATASALVGAGAGAAAASVSGLWKITGTLLVGATGAGALSIAPGGTVTTTDKTWLGANAASSTGTMTVAGYFKSGNSLYIGGTGAGVFEVTGAGDATATGVAIGGEAAASTTGSGVLRVAGTAAFSTGVIYVGRYGAGDFIITDAGSATVTNLYIGETGAGTLDIGASGTLVSTANENSLGRYAGATGAATIAGYWENRGNFFIGNAGSGTLLVAAGGAIRSTGALASIGHAGGTGAVTVAGHWAVSNTLSIGRAAGAAGALTVDGGTVATGPAYIGEQPGSTGTLAILGAGTAGFTSLYVGHQGAGALTVTASAAAGGNFLYLGSGSGGIGTGTIAGVYTLNNDLYLGSGSFGTGTLTLAAGGKITDSAGAIGYQTAGTGAATVSGLWDNSTNFHVGRSGDGDLVLAGGTVTAAAQSYLGYNATAVGTATVAPGGLWQTATNLYIGNSGTGLLSIAAAGAVTAGNNAFVGTNTTASGSAAVAGSLSATGTLYVGYNGVGALDILPGGAVAAARAYVGNGSTAFGSATVAADALWQVDSNLVFGNSGTGLLSIGTGGTVASGYGYIGNNAASRGSATVSGLWRNNGALYVGNSGSGALAITGGTVATTGAAYLGDKTAGAGSATVSAGGLWQVTGAIYVAQNGAGALSIAGGAATAAAIYVGNSAASTGALAIGAGGLLDIAGTVYVGYNGTGTLSIASGGTLHNANIGYVATSGGTGAATVAGTWLSDGEFRLAFGWSASPATAPVGTLDILPGGAVIGGADTNVGASYTSAATASVAGLWRTAGNFTVGRDSGDGARAAISITGTGAIHAGGNYTQRAQTTLALDLAGAAARAAPFVTATGAATLGGELSLDNYAAAAALVASATKAGDLARPGAGILLFRAAGGIIGDFSTINTITGAAAAAPVHLAPATFILGGTDYYAGHTLAWNASPALAGGSFDIPEGTTFEVDVPLVDRAPVGSPALASGWDGRSLSKTGAGTLILSAANTFTGTAAIAAGTLILNGPAQMTLGALVNTGTIDFGSPANAAPAAPPGVTAAPSLDGYRTLAVSSLAGDGAFRMKIDLAAGKSDRLVVAGDATGTHRLLLTPAGADPAASPTGDETKLTLVQIAGVPAAGFPAEISGTALAFDGGFNQGAFNYIAQTAGGAVTIANNGLNSDAAAITGVPGAQSLLVLASQDNLGHRLGHFRAPDPELGDLWLSDRWEIWALARAARFSINAAAGTRASRLLSYGAELGADKTWRLAAERATLGLALGAGAAAQTFRGLPAGTSADGDSRQLTAAAYAAWVHNNGIFANATLAATRLSNTFSSTDQSANRTTASYADTALAATLEAGKRFNLNSAVDGCFLEPSASFTHLRLERSSYTTAGANLLSVRATGATVTRLRAALRAGRAWRLGAAGDRGYLELAARLAASRETSTGGEIRIGSDTWRPNLDGNRLEAGAGLIWSPRVNTRLHLDYDAACSRPCDKPWGLTLGCHHLF